MLKLLKAVFIALAIVSVSNAADKISSKELKEIESLNLFKNAQITVTEGYDMDSVYLLRIQARGNSDTIYLTKDKKYLIAGNVIGTADGKKLDVPADLSKVIGKEAFIYGKGKDEYILFTDPECPYCKKFESYFTQVEDKVKIRIFFFPLSFHPNAKDISLYIMAQDSKEAKSNAFLNTTKDTPAFVNRKIDSAKLEKLQKSLDEQMAIGSKLGVAGTPSLFDGKGNKVSWVEMLAGYGIKVQ
jgi:thiol:disulfide interchange protein DsbC